MAPSTGKGNHSREHRALRQPCFLGHSAPLALYAVWRESDAVRERNKGLLLSLG